MTSWRWAVSLAAVVGVSPIAAAVPTSGREANTSGALGVDTLPGQIIEGRFVVADEARAWRLYVPSRRSAGPQSLLVMLHGCTQDAADFARGTRVEQHAEAHGMLVLLPEQGAESHPQRCWNWYEPSQHGREGGEVALLAALIDSVRREHGVSASRVHLGGLSAGGAMAALLATAFPERFASLTVASGVPVGAASNVGEALLAMRNGPAATRASAEFVRQRMGDSARAVPLLVMHGESDAVVSPRNADALLAQWRGLLQALEIVLAPLAWRPAGIDASHVHVEGDARGRVWLMALRVPTLGHAWSGGDASGSYTAPDAPDATAMLFAFLQQLEQAGDAR